MSNKSNVTLGKWTPVPTSHFFIATWVDRWIRSTHNHHLIHTDFWAVSWQARRWMSWSVTISNRGDNSQFLQCLNIRFPSPVITTWNENVSYLKIFTLFNTFTPSSLYSAHHVDRSIEKWDGVSSQLLIIVTCSKNISQHTKKIDVIEKIFQLQPASTCVCMMMKFKFWPTTAHMMNRDHRQKICYKLK